MSGFEAKLDIHDTAITIIFITIKMLQAKTFLFNKNNLGN